MKHLRHFAAINTLDGEPEYQETVHEITDAYQARNPDGVLIQYFVFANGSYVAFPADIENSIVPVRPAPPVN